MKVVIDSFDNKEQAVCFIDWLSKQSDAGKIHLFTTNDGLIDIEFDGVDTDGSDDKQFVVNIVSSQVNPYDEL